MKKMTKERQMQVNGGSYNLPWIGACTTCNMQFSAWTKKKLQQKGLEHHQKYYTKKEPHRWVYIKMGY